MNAKGDNVLILGNNTRFAKIFSCFSQKVFLCFEKQLSQFERLSDEEKEYIVVNYVTKKEKFPFLCKNRISEISRIITDNKIDIVFVNRIDDMILSYRAIKHLTRKPLLLATFHNSLSWHNWFQVFTKKMLIEKYSDGCICLARFMYNQLSKSERKNSKYLYLPNTIDDSSFFKKTNYLSGPIFRICYVAVINKNKNQLFIAKTIKNLHKSINVHVDFIGDIVDKKYLCKINDYLLKNNIADNFTFCGRMNYTEVKEKLPFYDLYFSSSKSEMSPYNILEAKACGLPILASHAYGQQDLIKNGIDGVLYKDNNLSDSTSLITSLINSTDYREQLGSCAIQSIKSDNNYRSAANTLLIFIKRLKNEKK